MPFRMSESGREALLDVQKWSGVPPGCPGVVERPSRMSGSGSGGPPGCPGVVWRPSRMTVWSECPPGCPGVVGGHPNVMETIPGAREAHSDIRESLVAHSDVREQSEGPPGCPGVVRRPTQMLERPSLVFRRSSLVFRSGRRPTRKFERPSLVFGRPSRMSGSGREALPNVREWSMAHPDVREWSGGPTECPGVVGRLSQMSVSGR